MDLSLTSFVNEQVCLLLYNELNKQLVSVGREIKGHIWQDRFFFIHKASREIHHHKVIVGKKKLNNQLLI